MMDEVLSTGCFSQASQPSEDTTTSSSQSQASLFPSWSTFPRVSSQPKTASLTTTTLPVWSHAPPRTQTLGGGSNQEFVCGNPSTFPLADIRSTPVTSNPAPFFAFSAPKAVSPSGQSVINESRLTLRPSRKQQFPLTMPKKEPSQNRLCLPSTSASSMFSSLPGPSTSAAPKTLPSTTASSMFSSLPGPSTRAAPKTLPSTSASSMFSSLPGPTTRAAPKTLPSTSASSMFSSLPGPSTSAAPKTLPSTTASSVFSCLSGPSTSAAPKTLPSTTASSVFLFLPEPSTSTAPKMYSPKPVTMSAGNVFSSVETITLPPNENLQFISYPPLPTEGKNNSLPAERENNTFKWNSTFNSSQPAPSRNTFGLRGSLSNSFKNYPKVNFNNSGQSSLHYNNRLPAKFTAPIEEDGRIQSITAMAEYSSQSFEEIRLEYYKMHKKTFVFGTSAFSFNTPYFFSSRNEENKLLVHKEVQTSGDNVSDTVRVKGLFDEIWRILECIICLDIVKSPIMQCESGHHFCNQCWSKVAVCPVCKGNKTTVRNYALESVFDKLPTSCKYHDEGCEAMVIAKDKEKHESSCCFQPFTCPIEPCIQKVDQKSLMSHCVTSHEIYTSVVECTLDNRSYVWNDHNAELRKYICVFNLLQWGMFLLCHKEVEHTSCIWLQLLHVNSEDSNFMYEIQLSDTENCQSVSYKGPVTHLSFNAEEAKHKCLRISSKLLFVMRSAGLQMKLEIWKKHILPA